MAAKKVNAEINAEPVIEAEQAVETVPAEEPATTDYWNEKETYRIPFDRTNTDDVFVSVNGKTWQIRRGVDVELPRNVIAVVDQSLKAEYDAYLRNQKMESDFNAKAKEYNV